MRTLMVDDILFCMISVRYCMKVVLVLSNMSAMVSVMTSTTMHRVLGTMAIVACRPMAVQSRRTLSTAAKRVVVAIRMR